MTTSDTPTAPMFRPTLEDNERVTGERERIVTALAACAGNQTRAAKALGISRATLVNKLAIHRLARPQSTVR